MDAIEVEEGRGVDDNDGGKRGKANEDGMPGGEEEDGSEVGEDATAAEGSVWLGRARMGRGSHGRKGKKDVGVLARVRKLKSDISKDELKN